MPSTNIVILAGHLTRDPELKTLAGGNAVADLGLAVSEKYKDKSGEFVESVVFADVAVWGRQAETCAEYLTKGSPVLIEGKLQFDQWEDQNGGKRSKLRVKATRVQFLKGPDKGPERPQEARTPVGVGKQAEEDELPF